MFSKKNKTSQLVSPVTGKITTLEETGDEVFANKLLGDGVAICPTEGNVVSPCDGTIQSIPQSSHAYSILSDDGLEVLVHIGIDTVELRGEGFDRRVSAGDRVKKGQTICNADLDYISSKGYSTVTPIVVSNMDSVSFFERKSGNVKCGEGLIDYII